MAKKPLPTPHELRQLLDYDPKTGFLTWKARSPEQMLGCRHINQEAQARQWNKWKAGKVAGTSDRRGYTVLSIHGKFMKAHRVGWAITYGEWPRYGIDHIDGNPANNSISNLREATQMQNALNTKAHKGGSSLYKGVCWHSMAGKWMAQARVNGRGKYIGLFENERDAAAAYNEFISKHSNGFARLNKIGESHA